MIKIAEIRKEYGVSQKNLAKHLNISQGNLCEWEKGRIEPNIDFLNKIADYFSISIDELVGRKEIIPEKTIKKISSGDFSAEEIAMIQKIRLLGPYEQTYIKAQIDALSDTQKSKQKEKI